MITHDARWSLSCGNNPVLSPWLVTAGQTHRNGPSGSRPMKAT